jgi:hypothetical protein
MNSAPVSCGRSSERHGEMKLSANRSPSIGLEPACAGDDVIPGIVFVVKHGDARAFVDRISPCPPPTRDSRSARGHEMIGDLVVPVSKVASSIDYPHYHLAAPEELDFPPALPHSNGQHDHGKRHDDIDHPSDIKVQKQDPIEIIK